MQVLNRLDAGNAQFGEITMGNLANLWQQKPKQRLPDEQGGFLPPILREGYKNISISPVSERNYINLPKYMLQQNKSNVKFYLKSMYDNLLAGSGNMFLLSSVMRLYLIQIIAKSGKD